MTRAVVFDLFGTLVSWPQGRPHTRALARELGIEFETFRPVWSKTWRARETGQIDAEQALRSVCAEVAFAASEERIQLAAGAWTSFVRSVLVPRDGALETLAALRSRGVRTGLMSDAPLEVSRLWDASPLAPLIDAAVFSCSEGAVKPDPRLYEAVVRRLGVEPVECVYSGNGDGEELAGALRAGMRAVLFTGPGEPPGREAAAWTGARISALAEILEMV